MARKVYVVQSSDGIHDGWKLEGIYTSTRKAKKAAKSLILMWQSENSKLVSTPGNKESTTVWTYEVFEKTFDDELDKWTQNDYPSMGTDVSRWEVE